jgi:hypothetical protein
MIYLNGINGVTIHSVSRAGVLDGNGQTSSDQWAANPNFARSTAIYINGGSDITITGFTVKNVPNAFFGQKGGVTNVNYASLTMTAASKSTNAPKNTMASISARAPTQLSKASMSVTRTIALPSNLVATMLRLMGSLVRGQTTASVLDLWARQMRTGSRTYMSQMQTVWFSPYSLLISCVLVVAAFQTSRTNKLTLILSK